VLRSILVPLDGSDFAEHALPLALSLARHAGAKLHLALVHRPGAQPAPMTLDVADLHARQDEQAYLADVRRRVGLCEDAPADLKTALLFGDVGEALKGYADREAVGLVVMATHARGAMGRFWLGSVSDEVTSRLTQPVLLVRPGEGKADLDRRPELESIVVPLDGSPQAEGALEPAAERAGLFGAELALVRVNPPVLPMEYLPEAAGMGSLARLVEDVELAERREREQAQEYLKRVASRPALAGVRLRIDVVLGLTPVEGILEEAHERHAGLIALETHARRGLARFFFGNVADDVVRAGEVPVLVHHG